MNNCDFNERVAACPEVLLSCPIHLCIIRSLIRSRNHTGVEHDPSNVYHLQGCGKNNHGESLFLISTNIPWNPTFPVPTRPILPTNPINQPKKFLFPVTHPQDQPYKQDQQYHTRQDFSYPLTRPNQDLYYLNNHSPTIDITLSM